MKRMLRLCALIGAFAAAAPAAAQVQTGSILVRAADEQGAVMPGVAITISVQTATSDPQTRGFVTVTESLLNISPRNVLAGLENARTNLLMRLQPTPAITWPS